MKKNSPIEFMIILVLAILYSIAASGGLDFLDNKYNYDYDGENTVYFEPDELPQELTTYFYDQLDNTDKKIYDGLYAAALEGKFSVTFSEKEFQYYKGDLMRIMRALTYEHPELFWLGCGYSATTSGSLMISFYWYDYWYYVQDKEEKIKALDAAADAVAEKALAYENHYERIKFVHDYLVANAMYDHDSLAETEKSVYDPVHDYIYSAYGCLVNGKTVCAGYAKAFQMIMQKLGYECLYVSGYAGESHAWNLIFVDDEGYYVDVTWDDPDYRHDEAIYSYFCIDDELITRTHTARNYFTYPECDSDKYNYFEVNGFILDEYDFKALCKILLEQKGKHILSVRFTNEEALKAAEKDLFEGKKLFSIPALSGANSVSYSVDESMYTIILLPKN